MPFCFYIILFIILIFCEVSKGEQIFRNSSINRSFDYENKNKNDTTILLDNLLINYNPAMRPGKLKTK
jgi:hypothetical protein